MIDSLQNGRHTHNVMTCYVVLTSTPVLKLSLTDMKLESSGGARRVFLTMQIHLLRLHVLRLQGTPAQEVDTVGEAKLPAL